MGTRRTAVSYSRFSDPKQAQGDSETRQWADFVAFCKRHGLTPAKDHYSDRGRSGFKGHHRTKGDLGRFEQLVKEGVIPRGTVLVVEALDRLSRQRPDKALALISSLLEAGIDIGVTRL